MASRASALLLLALFGAVLFLQVALADVDVDGVGRNGEVVTTSTNEDSDDSNMTAWDDQDSKDQLEIVEDDQLLDMTDQGSEGDQLREEDRLREEDQSGEQDQLQAGAEEDQVGEEVQPYLYVPEADEVDTTDSPDDEDQQQVTSVAAHPLARILQQRSSKNCFYSSKRCRRFYSWPGCCHRKCVNFSNNNRHCGRCGKCCDTRRGYFCRSGRCKKRYAPTPMCSKTKKCKSYGKTCCNGKCVDVKSDCKNCGKCSTKCGFGSSCCDGKCKNLKNDCQNCGKCGRKCAKGQVCCSGHCKDLKTDCKNCGKCGKNCGWGRKCCNGKCINIQCDKNNCGRCGKKCAKNVKCKYGICGYGH